MEKLYLDRLGAKDGTRGNHTPITSQEATLPYGGFILLDVNPVFSVPTSARNLIVATFFLPQG
jgi:hypothetical protein